MEMPLRNLDEHAALRAILEGTATETGQGFFRALVRSLGEALRTHGAWVTEYLPERRRLRSLAFWMDGGYVDHGDYEVAGTPCEAVVERAELIHHPDNIIELYPGDNDLGRLKAVSFLGTPLVDLDERVLGHLAVLDTRPLPHEPRLMELFQVFGTRAAAELQRMRREDDLRDREEKLTGLVDGRWTRSVSDGKAPAVVAMGAGAGLLAAAGAATEQIQTRGLPASPRWIKLDVVREVGPIERLGARGRLRGARGRSGLLFVSPLDAAFLAEEVLARGLIDERARLLPERALDYLRLRDGDAKARTLQTRPRRLTVRRFSTFGYLDDTRTTVRLFRGRVPRYRFHPTDLLAAAEAAGRYLARVTSQSGKFRYSYDATRDAFASRYNLVRHAGTVYSILELFEVTGEKELLDSCERAIGYLLKKVEPWGPETAPVAIIVEKGKIKLGGVALALLALAKHKTVTGSDAHLPLMRRLAGYIRSVQQPDGRFISQIFHPSGKPRDWTSGYYPGEALFALTRLYELDRDEAWLDVATKGARYLILERDKGLEIDELTHDHWLLYALNELHRYRPLPLFSKQSLRIARAIYTAQNRDPARPEHLGSFYNPPRSTPTATRSEGLLAAYQLARRVDREDEAREILKTVVLAIGFQLQTQFTPGSALYQPAPAGSLGGFARSLTDYEVRIDYVQHNLSALLALYRVMEEEGLSVLGEELSW